MPVVDKLVNKVMNKVIVSLLAVGVVALSACGGGDDPVTGPVTVDQPWARATSAAQPHGAVYFDLTVDHDDLLTGASVPAAVADRAEIHEVVDAEPHMPDHEGGHSGTAPGMIMREVVGGLAVSADETVTFAPGGYHVMLIDLADPLDVGDEFELTLTFAGNADVTVTVSVEETAP